MTTNQISQLSDDDLLTATTRAVETERGSTAHVLRLLTEVDERRLYLGRGYSSMFAYCTRALRYSEQAAYDRIAAARAARRFPLILDALTSGDLTLSAVTRLAPHLTDENGAELIEAAIGKSTRDVERLIASLHPAPDVPSSVRALPTREAPPLLSVGAATAESPEQKPAPARPAATPPTRRPVVAAFGSKSFLIKVTVSETTHDRLRRLQALMRHSVPSGDPAEIIDRALVALLEKVERGKWASTPRPRAQSTLTAAGRRIPAVVRRAVWRRDAGQCAFQGTDGRCAEAAFLEFHHMIPFAAGGKATPDNIQLRCRAHNGFEARLFFDDETSSAQGGLPRP